MAAMSFLSHIFPTPKYLTLPSVGVDVSDSSLKYIQFEQPHSHDTNLRLKAWGSTDIPEGVVERGTVHDVDKLSQVLAQVKKKTGAEYVRVSLPEERAYLFETTIKHGTPFKEIRGLLEFKLEENVPLSPRDAYFDYDVVHAQAGEAAMEVVVAVYAKNTINGYFEACRKAGLVPRSFEIEAQAIGRAAIPKDTTATHMIVDLGKTRTGVGIVHNGALMYTSTIESGGQAFSTLLREKLGDLSDDECTEIKNTRGLTNTKENADVYGVLNSALTTVVEEIQTRIHYWHTRDVDRKNRNIKRVILCGGESNMAGLPQYLASALEIPTEQAAVWNRAFSLDTFIPPITRRYSYGYATAIGLALADFIIE